MLDEPAFATSNRNLSSTSSSLIMAEEQGAKTKPADQAAPAVTPSPAETPAMQRYRIRLAFWQAICGMIVSGGVAVAIPAGVDAYKARLELQKADLELRLKQKEIDEKRIDAYQDYVSKFIATALNQDIELRLRFSEYFAYVADSEAVDKWKRFHDDLQVRRETIRRRIEDNEMRAAQLRALAKPDMAQQIELDRLAMELGWDYAEVGYARLNTNITAPSSSVGPSITKDDVVSDSATRFAAATVDVAWSAQLAKIVDALVADRPRYDKVSGATGIPWYVVAILHRLETGARFTVHFNGDPLSERTVRDPKGLPTEGTPPFTWEDSTIAYLRQSSLAETLTDYDTTGGTLYRVERFNGLGYRHRGSSSPYVWACTDQYVAGGSANFGSAILAGPPRFCGFAAILKTMQQKGIVTLHSF